MIGQHNQMHFQHDWRGNKIVNLRVLVHADELDKPQRQLGNLILPADPQPIRNARVEQYPIDEYWSRLTQQGQPRYLQRSVNSRILQISVYNTTTKF